ncbi:hypothetical protein [Denitratimonas sp. CY0512]|uniref:hypothetical protein n=1 Tax=Denitratimonas sp. CY0512 TaxID=3131940 RepID=UPI0030ACBDDB
MDKKQIEQLVLDEPRMAPVMDMLSELYQMDETQLEKHFEAVHGRFALEPEDR